MCRKLLLNQHLVAVLFPQTFDVSMALDVHYMLTVRRIEQVV